MYTNYVQVTQWCSTSAPTFLCLHTGTTSTPSCKMISCSAIRNDDFELPATDLRYKVGTDRNIQSELGPVFPDSVGSQRFIGYRESLSGSHSKYPHQIGYRESLSDSRVWKKYTNPAEWFNGITGLQEAVCMAVVLACVALFILGIILITTDRRRSGGDSERIIRHYAVSPVRRDLAV
eukprot:sb/3471838/